MVEETKNLLTTEEQEYLELLEAEETLDEDQTAELKALKVKKAGNPETLMAHDGLEGEVESETEATTVEEVENEVEAEAETEAEVTETIEAEASEAETTETESQTTEDEIITVEAEEVENEESKQLLACGHTFKMLTVLEVQKERPDHNQIWCLYEAELENGLACSTKCFAIDVSKKLKEGDELELPPTACTIRQSHRKQRDGDNSSKPATFDWLHI